MCQDTWRKCQEEPMLVSSEKEFHLPEEGD